MRSHFGHFEFGMLIREAQLEDGEDLTRLLDQLGYPDTDGFIEDRIRALSDDKDSGILVCLWENRPVGFLAYHLFLQLGLEGGFCRIAYFCVDEMYRGRGVGEALEAEIVRIATKKKCDRIELHCSEHRARAHGFYQKLGYRESPRYLMKSISSS